MEDSAKAENPWSELPDEPLYVLAEDRRLIEDYNAKRNAKPDTLVRLEILPDPFIGDLQSARIVMLALCASFRDEDLSWSTQDDFREAQRKNLLRQRAEYPFYALDPKYAGSPAAQWWYPRLRSLREEVGSQKLSERFAVIQWFPYHAKTFSGRGFFSKNPLPSQFYGFKLAAEVVADKAKVVIVATTLWEPCVRGAPNVVRLRAARNSSVTEGNMESANWIKIIEALSS